MKDYFKENENKNENKAEIFYDTIRCGILHQAETKKNSLIRYRKKGDWEENIPFERISDNSMIVYWASLFNLLKREIEEYKNKLKSGDQTLRGNFRKKMDFICRGNSS